jgi:hypothetical protein
MRAIASYLLLLLRPRSSSKDVQEGVLRPFSGKWVQRYGDCQRVLLSLENSRVFYLLYASVFTIGDFFLQTFHSALMLTLRFNRTGTVKAVPLDFRTLFFKVIFNLSTPGKGSIAFAIKRTLDFDLDALLHVLLVL